MSGPKQDTHAGGRTEVFTIEQIAVRCGVDVAFVSRLVSHGVIEPASGQTDRFEPVVTLRVQRVVRLQRDLGVNLQGASVILELLRRIDDLERELRLLRSP